MTTPPLDLPAERLTALRDIANAATDGPWAWRGNTDTQQLRLTVWAKGVGECTVMDFERWGMQSASPRFIDADHFMVSGKGLAVYQVVRNQGLPDDTPRDHPKVYRADVVDINHPDARHIAAFDPPTALALLDRLEAAERDLAAVTVSRDGWKTRAEAAEKKVAAVREVHPRVVIAVHESHGEEAMCPQCQHHYPCPTITALDTHTPETETAP